MSQNRKWRTLVFVIIMLVILACNAVPSVRITIETPTTEATVTEPATIAPVPSRTPLPTFTPTPDFTDVPTLEPSAEIVFKCVGTSIQDKYWYRPNDDKVTMQLDYIRELVGPGGWFRFDVSQIEIEKERTWLLDWLYEEAEMRDLGVILIITQWGALSQDWDEVYVNANAFVEYGRRLGAWSVGKKVMFQITNEPSEKGPDAFRYTMEFLIPTYDAIKSENPDAVVISATITPGDVFTWIDDMYTAAREYGEENDREPKDFFDYFGYTFYAQEGEFRLVDEIADKLRENNDFKPVAVLEFGVAYAGDDETVSKADVGPFITSMFQIAIDDYSDIVSIMCPFRIADKLSDEDGPKKLGFLQETEEGFVKNPSFNDVRNFVNPDGR